MNLGIEDSGLLVELISPLLKRYRFCVRICDLISSLYLFLPLCNSRNCHA